WFISVFCSYRETYSFMFFEKSSLTYWYRKEDRQRGQRKFLYGFGHILTEGSPLLGKRGNGRKKVNKGTRGMPRLPEARKDATSCDKPRGSANTNRSAGFRMGQPAYLKDRRIIRERAELKHLSRRRRR